MGSDFSDERSEFSPAEPAWRRSLIAFLQAPFAGKFRRLYLTAFRPGYVRAQNQRRSGRCNQCGACCRLVHRCVFLRRNNRCLIYGEKRPAACRFFPIDWRDLRDVRGSCGFHFGSRQAIQSKPIGSHRPTESEMASKPSRGSHKRLHAVLRNRASSTFEE